MPLSAGDRLGPYEVLAPIGAGGMGEVWKAHDPRLNRDVAIKISAQQFSDRFEREARFIAALNHPNICTLFDVGPNYLVMELVDGRTLAERIAQEPIPMDETLAIAKQIADALEAAHEKGIIHRDLKPANIKIEPDGQAKVLDFGLAKTVQPSSGDPQSSPTLTMAATQAGMIVGTAAYMSPEQAAGKTVDKRSDIWSFGVVLWELLTSHRLFEGETVSHTLANVLRGPIDFDRLPGETPAAIRVLLRRCLDRNPKNRLRDIGEARIAIDSALAGETTLLEGARRPGRARLLWLGWSVAGTAVLAVALWALGWWRVAQPVDHPLMRFTDDLAAELSLNSSSGPAIAISPDGLRLAFISRDLEGSSHLSVRSIGSSKSTVVAGTDGAAGPFFSPDGRWIAFFADQRLKKIPAEGGAAVVLCDAPNARGGAWGDDGNIFFEATPRVAISRVSSSGGTPQPATEFDKQKGDATHRFPQALPGSKGLLFTTSPDNNSYEKSTIEIQSVKTGTRKTLVEGYFGRYLPSGHLIYFHGSKLWAARMDLNSMDLAGPAVPILEDVSDHESGLAQLDFTPSGTLVYVAGSTLSQRSLFWLDVSGSLQRLQAESGPYSYPRASPDGTRIALLVSQGSGTNLSVYELASNRMTPVTFLKGDVKTFPTWTPDSKHLLFPLDSQELSGPGIYWMRADGVGEPRRLLEGANLATYSVSPDARRLAFFRRTPEYAISTAFLDLADPEHPKVRNPEVFLASKFDLRLPAFSPDGRWMAYVSPESGSIELYVRPFPGEPSASGKWKISTGAVGGSPYWSQNGSELFYYAADGRIWVSNYTVKGNSFEASQPRLWSPKARPMNVNQLFLMPDGKRFITVMPTSAANKETHVTFLLNFFDELRRRAPAGGK